jgi:hypothetical protein
MESSAGRRHSEHEFDEVTHGEFGRTKMSKLKNMSRGGYIVVGSVTALILVPTGIAAAAVAYNGIEGTNGTTTTINDAHVTSAGQLLTTEAAPSTFREYSAYVAPMARR